MFKLSVSKIGYNHKPNSSDLKKMNFQIKNYNAPVEVIEDIKNGYCFTNLFGFDAFWIGKKTKSNFKESYSIFLDFDHTNGVDIDDMLKKVSITPNVVYYTPSSTDNDPRFRFVYLFDIPMNLEEYKSNLGLIADGVENYIDLACLTEDKYFNGTTKDKEVRLISNTPLHFKNTDNLDIYNKLIGLRKGDKKQKPSKSNIVNSINHTIFEIEDCHKNVPINPDFLNDFRTLKYNEMIDKYHTIYNVELKTRVVKKYKWSLDYTDDFCEITPIYFFDKDKQMLQHRKYQHGDYRKRWMFTHALMLKRINPQITIENLIYSLYNVVAMMYDNTDKKITRKILMERAISAYNSNYAYECKSDKKWEIDKQVAACEGLTNKQALVEAKLERRYAMFCELYDAKLTKKENMQNMGISNYGTFNKYLGWYMQNNNSNQGDISEKPSKSNIDSINVHTIFEIEDKSENVPTTKMSRKERKEAILALYDSSLTLKENMQILEDNNIVVTYETYKKYIQRNIKKKQPK